MFSNYISREVTRGQGATRGRGSAYRVVAVRRAAVINKIKKGLFSSYIPSSFIYTLKIYGNGAGG